ncbi:HET-domain-containing protein [Xylariaceae sp. FL0016]|nr:HET-domain-containing protein [Xylariaceae sp. FL0016]
MNDTIMPNLPQGSTSNDRYMGSLALCEQCRVWDDITNHRIDYPGVPSGERTTTTGYNITVDQLERNRHCAVCAFVLEAFQLSSHELPSTNSWPAKRLLINVQGPFYLDLGFSSRQPDLKDPRYISIKTLLRLNVEAIAEKRETNDEDETLPTDWSLSGPFSRPSDSEKLYEITPQLKMVYEAGAKPKLCKLEPWNVPYFDTSILRSWVQCCEQVHGVSCYEKDLKGFTADGFRLIDTAGMNIVRPESLAGIRYVALSYMWSDNAVNTDQLTISNAANLEAPGSLADLEIPPIIKDAVALCREMGEQYLWTDRLCIVQDDISTKMDQINIMDKIYRSAAFTIVAALKTRNSPGLPGMKGLARYQLPAGMSLHHTVEVEGQGIKLYQLVERTIDTTLWNKRAWTFQERLLSGRCLFITDTQAIYQCRQDVAFELLTWAPNPTSHPFTDPNATEESRKQEAKLRGIGFRVDREYGSRSTTVAENTSLEEYVLWVADYSSRQFSYGTDILNAFSGVGNALSSAFGSRMLFGIPEKYLAQCLMWDSDGTPSLRSELHVIPSWSWASSLKPVNYSWCDDKVSERALEIVSLVYYHYQDPNHGRRRLDVEERWMHHDITIEETANMDELPILRGKGLPGEWRTNRDWHECPQNARQILTRKSLSEDACRVAMVFPGCLIFNTTVASLAIDHLRTNEKHDTFNASLCNSQGEHIGILSHMDFDWVELRRSTRGNRHLFDFICLSGRLESYSVRKWLAFDNRHEDMWLLHVMMVERLPCRPFVARRVAVGTVKLCKWKDCEPRWETVVLC